MGQHISVCKSGSEPSIGSFDPFIGERRKRRLPGPPPKSLLFHHNNNDDNTAPTASTGHSSSKASFSQSSPFGSSSEANVNVNGNNNSNSTVSLLASPDRDTNQIKQPLPLRYTTSTRNLQNQTPEASATTATTTIPLTSTRDNHPCVDTNTDPAHLAALQQRLQQQQQQNARIKEGIRNHHCKGRSYLQQQTAPVDKRSNPVKFPRRRQAHRCPGNDVQRNETFAHPNVQEAPQASYLERMYDSRTWEMYRRITTHREKVEAFNVANASAKQDNDDDRNSTNRTYMSDPVQRVTNSTTMVGGVDYDNFYDPATEDDDSDSRGGGAFLLEDHSAPPYHHHRQCDNGQHHHDELYHTSGQCHNAESYSEWEHMYGDDVEAVGVSGNNSTNAHGANHETIFLFDF